MVITHNLLRAAGTLAGGKHAVARGATLRRDLVNVPAPLRRAGPQTDVAPARQLALANRMENPVAQRHRLPDQATTRRLTRPTSLCPPRHPRPDPRNPKESWSRPADHPCPPTSPPRRIAPNRPRNAIRSPIHGFRLSTFRLRATLYASATARSSQRPDTAASRRHCATGNPPRSATRLGRSIVARPALLFG
jgi:hypothetical protein